MPTKIFIVLFCTLAVPLVYFTANMFFRPLQEVATRAFGLHGEKCTKLQATLYACHLTCVCDVISKVILNQHYCQIIRMYMVFRFLRQCNNNVPVPFSRWSLEKMFWELVVSIESPPDRHTLTGTDYACFYLKR